jgi:predicted nucleotidyltransferase
MPSKIDQKSILNYLKNNYSEFQEKYQVEKIGLFGSYARSEETESSDIDIFVQMKPSLFKMVAIKDKIEADLNKKVDIVREHKNMKPFFLQMIKKDLIYAV